MLTPQDIRRAAFGSLPYVIAIAVGLLGAAVFYRPATVAPEISALKAAKVHADSALVSSIASARAADSLRSLADSAFAARDSALARADSIGRVASKLRGSFTAQAAVAPDTCRAVIAAADSALDAADVYADSLRGTILRSQIARFDLEASLDTARAALTRLQSAVVPLSHAVEVVVERTEKRSLLERLMPHKSIGATAGIDASGKPNVVYGVSLGWSF